MTQLYLANRAGTLGYQALERHAWTRAGCGLLIAFPYVEMYSEGVIHRGRTMLDSGAFTAWNAGTTIDIEALIDESKKPRWDEAVALDVLGDWQGSRKNALYMQSRGSPAFPVFHYGEPWELLDEYCEKFQKVGLAVLVAGPPRAKSLAWIDQCFARRYPHRFHSFGWASRWEQKHHSSKTAALDVLWQFPFHSADSSSWALVHWGQWVAWGRGSQQSSPSKLGRASHQSSPSKIRAAGLTLAGLIDARERVQHELRTRWARELEKLEFSRSDAKEAFGKVPDVEPGHRNASGQASARTPSRRSGVAP